jgi:flavin-dependent dehydrogenase
VTFDFDVAIVGGGPAGSSTALHMVRRERIAARRVVMLERAKHPRDKPCAGAVSSWGLETLAAIGVPLSVPHVPMRGLRVFAGDACGTHVSPLGVVVRRAEFDASLWKAAADAGVVVHDGEAVTGVERLPGGWKVSTPVRTVSARFLAACDGSGSIVRKALGFREAARKGHLYVAETPAALGDEATREGLCDFDLRVADDGIDGYYWDFPTLVDGKPGVNRGIYHANLHPRSDVKASFARALSRRGIDIDRVRIKPFSTRPLVRGTRFAFERLALVGEAAGIDRVTGEGIAQAILTGALASKHLARALRLRSGSVGNEGDVSLEGYQRDVMRDRVGRHMRQSAWLAEHVYGSRGASWRALFAREPLARELGARWYSGSSLAWTEKARLGTKLALALASG